MDLRPAPDDRQPLPLHDAAATRQLEGRALARTAPHALMARAGLAVARLALAVAPHAHKVVVFAGPGNNGGDGILAALHLHRLGRQVHVCHLADPQRLPADAADALRQARAAGLPLHGEVAAPDGADLVIDALLGLGAARPPAGAIARAIAAANDSGAPVLAVDLPSGLHADRGQPLGAPAIRARWTLSLLTLKPGLFTGAGRDHAGQVWLDGLGVVPDEPASAWLGASTAAPGPGLPLRLHAQHKGSFGDVFVVGGAQGMAGAAWLAARAALASGAGRVYLSALDPQPLPAALPELMQRAQVWLADAGTFERAVVVCGCGGGTDVAQALPHLMDKAPRLVLDADALNAVAGDASLQAQLSTRADRGARTVLTPHPLEAARLLGTSTTEVQADRLRAARELAARHRSVVLLKGSGTVIAAGGRSPWINSSGNAVLAAPGSGDVLAGWLGGLWARLPDDDGWFAARASAWLHGRAADHHAQHHGGGVPLRASDLVEAMAAAAAG